MNWFKKAQKQEKIAQLSGEYWITEDGMVLGADGDIDDMNHEAHVIQEVMDGITGDETMDWGEWKQQKIQGKKEEESYEDDEEALMEVLREEGVSNEEYQIAEGLHPDIRAYAMREFGHKRLEGTNIETWTLTSSDMRSIAEGLYDVYRDDALKGKFNIHVINDNKWYNEVPFPAIESGKLKELRDYDSKFGGYEINPDYQPPQS